MEAGTCGIVLVGAQSLWKNVRNTRPKSESLGAGERGGSNQERTVPSALGEREGKGTSRLPQVKGLGQVI